MTEPETRLSRRDAERLLDAPAEHDHVLGWALSAAAAPAHPDELRREDATAAAFHSARLSPAPSRRSHFVSPTRLGSRAAVQAVVATAAVAALASGGFALTGSIPLPSLPGQAGDRATDRAADRTSATTPSDASTPGPSGSAGGTAAGRPTTTKGSDATTGTPAEPAGSPTSSTSTDQPTPTPDLAGLCRAYQATGRDHGTSLDSAAFTALAAAAGGAAGIADYCIDLVGAPAPAHKPTPTSRPTPTTKPTPTKPTPTKPTPAKPTDQPTDKPTPAKPTDKPSPDKPGPGKPTAKPDSSGKGGGKDSSTSGS